MAQTSANPIISDLRDRIRIWKGLQRDEHLSFRSGWPRSMRSCREVAWPLVRCMKSPAAETARSTA
ncbi:hypothetical protein NE852_31510 (plasmid) [Rhizobium sp. Pop5]|uniref:hypothetical protein n=1 Tax=Rhizobium sp. Pop5 TaxID=1223565 RepID=UPI002157CF30|nr:hypothetical protein [Rhizobium sp. Pop5]UVD60297.1 hypothetical protein NE852_31510 [Rhizobium sp. Pop5]